MTDKQINKWLRRQFSVIGWLLIGYYLLMNLLAGLTMTLDAALQALRSVSEGNFFADLDYDALYGNAWGYLLTIAVSLVILHAWKGGDYWKREILVRNEKISPGILFCLLSFCIGAQMLNTVWITVLELIMNCFGSSVLPGLESVSGAGATFSMFLYASFAAPISEELIFRGWVLRALRPYGKRFSIVASALLFGLFHGNLLQAPYAFLVGLVLGYVTVEYSIHWAVFIHMFNNLVLADLLTRLTMEWSEMAVGILNLSLFGGFFLIALGILFRKRQEIRAYQQREWMDRRVWKCFLTSSGILVLSVFALLSMLVTLAP